MYMISITTALCQDKYMDMISRSIRIAIHFQVKLHHSSSTSCSRDPSVWVWGYFLIKLKHGFEKWLNRACVGGNRTPARGHTGNWRSTAEYNQSSKYITLWQQGGMTGLNASVEICLQIRKVNISFSVFFSPGLHETLPILFLRSLITSINIFSTELIRPTRGALE